MLTNVRNALLHQTRQPFPNLENNEAVYTDTGEPADILFAQEFTRVSGQFAFFEEEKECMATLASLAEQLGLQHIICREPSLLRILRKYSALHIEENGDLKTCDAGILCCEALIARTGSIVVSSRQASGRTLPVFPPITIFIAGTSQLVDDIQDGFALIRKKYDGNFPSLVNLSTGPSRTADIEKTLVLGAHGPREVYVFLIDNWQTD